MNVMEESLQKHREWKGKIEVCSRAKVNNAKDLTLAYTPGVPQPCLEIQKDPDLSYELTRRANLVAVITDGSAVLGLGNIGGLAGMPVMEGKCALFKEFADVDAFPLCIKSNDVDEIVNTIAMISDSFGGINLEDIAAPRCFEIEAKLKEKVDIPVFHDDQHGTAIVVGAALMNACKVANKKISDITLVINGAGAAGCAIGKLLLSLGIGNLIMVDRKLLKNPNGLILGTPGSGKSFSAKREITNAFLICPKDDIIICDPEAEYAPLVERLHGQVIKISPTSTNYINPMDLNLDYSDDESPLSLKSDFILSLCELIVGGKDGLQPVQKTIIDRCVRLVYQTYLNDPRPENMPILEDLYNLLRSQEEKEAQYIATALEIYVTGSLNVFNHQSNVDINNRIVCYDIKELGKQLKKIGMLVVQDVRFVSC